MLTFLDQGNGVCIILAEYLCFATGLQPRTPSITGSTSNPKTYVE